jgi:hypothetical protein
VLELKCRKSVDNVVDRNRSDSVCRITTEEIEMRELTVSETFEVSGGTDAGDIAMAAAGTWASAVAGAAIAGPGGAVVGFTLGLLISVGYILATD